MENRKIGWLPVIVVLIIGVPSLWIGIDKSNVAFIIFGAFELVVGIIGIWAILRNSKVPRTVCPNCKEPIGPGMESCPHCGIKL